MSRAFTFDPHKFREAVLFFAKQGVGDSWFGSTRLNKQLFLLDFYGYANFGQPVTGATYMHQDRGPVPKEFVRQREELVRSSRITIEEHVIALNRTQKRPVACDDPDMRVFSQEEVGLLDAVADAFRNRTASQVSEWSHGFAGWMLTRNGEVIPYFTAFVGDKNHLTLDDIAWGKEVAEAHAASLQAA